MAWVHRLSNINLEAKTATCSNCGNVKIRLRGSRAPRCVVAVLSESRGSGTRTGNQNRHKYKLSEEDYVARLSSQCEVCQATTNLCIDHDHSCCPGKRTCGECIRGVLCSSCNKAEGFLRSNPDIAEAMAAYLRKAR